MAFLDHFIETEQISIGNGYWIEIKTTLTHDEKERADRHMQKIDATVDERGKMHGVVSPDYASYRRALVAASIVAWNLDEADGTKWALSPDSARHRNIGRLPEHVFEAVYRRVDEVNKLDPLADRSFRTEFVGSAEDGVTGTADLAEIPVGDGAVEALGNTG